MAVKRCVVRIRSDLKADVSLPPDAEKTFTLLQEPGDETIFASVWQQTAVTLSGKASVCSWFYSKEIKFLYDFLRGNKSMISFSKVEFLYFPKGTGNSNQLHQSNDGSAGGEDRWWRRGKSSYFSPITSRSDAIYVDIFASVRGLLVFFFFFNQIYSKTRCNYFFYNDILKFCPSTIKNIQIIMLLNHVCICSHTSHGQQVSGEAQKSDETAGLCQQTAFK